jgi:hypothetical protein
VTLEQVLADAREDAAALRRHGHKHDAELIEALCDKVADAAFEYLNWLTEGEAKLRSGHSAEYRAVCVPQRGNREAAREAGRRAGAA